MGTAIIRHGRVLAARRTSPSDARGLWELPGGKVEPGERPEEAVVREIGEELGCAVEVTGALAGEQPVKPGYTLQVATAALRDGEPVPHEHDAVRWLGPEDLDEVPWMPSDVAFLAELRELLLDGHRLDGGNVGGAVRIGGTVRRATGPWTPAVHRLLRHLRDQGLDGVPDVLGVDARGREVLTYLDGEVPDVDGQLSEERLTALARWARRLHDAVDGFDPAGPWRLPITADADVLTHGDLALYNAVFACDRLVGMFDWDLAGPSTRLRELAHLVWMTVPLYRRIPVTEAARRLRLVADAYAGVTPEELLATVPVRIRANIAVITGWVADGDQAGKAQAAIGEPEHTIAALAALEQRLPAIEQALVDQALVDQAREEDRR